VPDELNLGDLLRSADSATTGKIDADAVIRRARRRRTPRLVGTALASVLAVVVVVGGAVYGLGNVAGSTTGASSAVDSSGSAPKTQPQTRPQPDGNKANTSRCGYPVSQIAPTTDGLVIAVEFPSTATSAGPVRGLATLTNTGAAKVAGSSGGPIITLARNGVVVWHTDAGIPEPQQKIVLAPGASMTFPVVLSPSLCSKGDDGTGALRTDLPPAPVGEYAISASIVVSIGGVDEQVDGPTHNLTIR
jgi:hypothetical protein